MTNKGNHPLSAENIPALQYRLKKAMKPSHCGPSIQKTVRNSTKSLTWSLFWQNQKLPLNKGR